MPQAQALENTAAAVPGAPAMPNSVSDASAPATPALTASSVPHRLTLLPLPDAYAIARLPADAVFPEWAAGAFVSVTRTADELSVVCREDAVPAGVRCDAGWVGWRVAGTFDLSGAVGVLASVVGPLADAGVGVFAVATFDTDYVLVRRENRERAAGALRRAGHTIA